MPKSLFDASSSTLVYRQVYVFGFLGGGILFSSVQFMEISQVFSLLLSDKCSAGSGGFFFLFLYFLFLFLIVHTLPETCECLCAVCLRVIIEFLRVQAIEKTGVCYFVAPPLVADLLGVFLPGHPHPLPG